MMMQHPWVHIIGAGVAGLSLAACLSNYETLPGDIVISDPSLDQPKSQTFCFWYQDQNTLPIQPESEWKCWSFSQDEEYLLHQGQRYRYGMISGNRLRSTLLHQIHSHPQIHLNHCFVDTAPQADHVFDSRPPRLEHFRIRQSFVGLEVEFEQPHHQTQVALMHDLRALAHGIEFRYVLPISPSRLLVEYTRFTTQYVDLADLEYLDHTWIRHTFGSNYSVKRTEAAHIPMGLIDHTDHFGVPIGARAGMTRDATGYGLLEIQKWAQSTARHLLINNKSIPYQIPMLRTWMDSCLLNIIEKRPDLMPRIFMHIGRHISADRFASFMMNCTCKDALHIIYSAPKKPFVLSAFKKL